ncbi:cytochrome b/b6 domain-containing protein [Paracoccus sp. DMF-8]|uniref:cytochrome b/b6 domain-containing protein n=1 Tax=Paracoccus sp. DMF-8 TaxID=3019445 RepID=UPI0023E80A66|nr:cytochrome b/b6 domain-containing protein [Paracoccus sp. DMF-8]MDF3605471.1 cytochrome b/b6 domain-containing protein [Paracoccus sp. DMF-8]
MKAVNDTRSYGWVSRIFHWSIAALILTAIGLGLYANALPHETQDELQLVFAAFSIHKTVGMVTLFLALARILWAIGQIKPRPLHPERRLETWAAEVVHWGLYAGMVVMPLSGWLLHAAAPGAFSRIIWPFGQRLPGVPESMDLSNAFAAFHASGWWVLAALIVLHVGGALKHMIIDRDATLARMAGNPGRVPEPPQQHHRASAILAAITGLLIWVAVAIGSQYLPGAEAEPETSGQAQPAETAPATVQEDQAATTDTQAASSAWVVETGTLRIAVNQGGSTVEGGFATRQAQIDYDPDSREGSVDVTIDIASLTLGAVSDNAKGPEFLNAAAFPEARFQAVIAPSEGDQLVARGDLTIAGQSVPAELPFDLVIDGDQAAASGKLTIDRRDFGVGQTYADESTVGFAVDIGFDLTAIRQ